MHRRDYGHRARREQVTNSAARRGSLGIDRPRAATSLFTTALRTRAGTRRAAVRREPLLEGFASTVEPDHRVVGCQSKLGGDLSCGHTVDDDPSQNAGVLRLELVDLDEYAPTVDPSALVQATELELIEWQDGLWAFPQRIEEHVPDDAANPSMGPGWVLYLLRALESPSERDL